MFSVIVSKTDPAGMNIAKQLIEEHSFKETQNKFDSNKIFELKEKQLQLVFINKRQVFAGYLNSLETDFFVFASLHRSESKKPSLTVHAIGNWGKAELGGKDKTLVPTSANLIKNYLIELQKQKEKRNLEQYDVSLEASHHGPWLPKPIVFIEIGSSEQQWNDVAAASAAAETIVNSTKTENNSTAAIGLGGGHYCPEFTRLLLYRNYTVSHICPKYALQNFNSEMLQKAVNATLEKVESVVLDWKGLGKEKQRIQQIAEESSLKVERVRALLK